MNVEDLILVSVDDHVIEPAGMFDAHIPSKYRERAPRVLTDTDGSEYWQFEDERAAYMGLNAVAGCPPEEFGLGPVFAIPKALKLAGLSLGDIAVIELNEAFAAQSLAVIQQAGLDASRVNPNGGAIALGHPLGCTGAKLTATVIRDLQRKNARYGMVTMCIGGGMGAAGIFERS